MHGAGRAHARQASFDPCPPTPRYCPRPSSERLRRAPPKRNCRKGFQAAGGRRHCTPCAMYEMDLSYGVLATRPVYANKIVQRQWRLRNRRYPHPFCGIHKMLPARAHEVATLLGSPLHAVEATNSTFATNHGVAGHAGLLPCRPPHGKTWPETVEPRIPHTHTHTQTATQTHTPPAMGLTP